MLLKKHSVFSSWLLSYIIILFVPIFFGIAVYESAEKTVESEINHSNRIMLEQTQQALDGGLQEIGRFINQVEINKKFILLMNMSSNDSKNYYDNNTLQAFDDFIYYRVLTGYINDYFIYFKNINKILNGRTLADPSIFYKAKIENGNSNGSISEEKWDKLLSGGQSGQYMIMDANKALGDDSVKGVAYSLSLPLDNKENAKATLVIFLNYKKIQGIIQSIQTANNGAGIILDKDNKLLFSTRNLEELPSEISYEKLKSDNNTVYMNINGELSVVSCINSREAGLKYISVIPYSIFWQKVKAIRLLTVVCTLLCIVLGILVSYLLARKNYSPVNQLLSSLVHKNRIPAARGFNEYKFIQDAISETINENQDMSEKLKQQNNALKSLFLMRLLKGKVEDQSLITDTLPLYNIKIQSDYFAVVAIYIKSFETLFERQYSDKTAEEKLSLVRFIIANVFEELVSQENYGYVTEVDEMNVCLVNFKDPENGRQKLMKAVNEAYEFIRSNFKIDFTIALSDNHKSFSGIPEAYREALNTVEYQIAVENGEITNYNDIKGYGGKYNYTIEAENQLINCIKAGDSESGISILEGIFENNFAKSHLSNSLLKCTMFGIANTMLKAMIEVSYICGEEFIGGLHIEDRLLKCEKVKELKNQMTDILEKVCSYIRQNKKGKRDQLIDSVAGYIEKNYRDANLSVTMISQRFDLTSAYLTKLFKEQMAEGIFDYISRVRIEKAKSLLKSQEDLNIKEIAERVGYNNSNVFIRTFKKYIGVTPGIFKGME